MLSKLREEQLLVHEKYGGIILTDKGKSMADSIQKRHALLVSFLKLLGAKESTAQKDTERTRRYIDTQTLDLLSRLVDYASRNPQWWNQFQKQNPP